MRIDAGWQQMIQQIRSAEKTSVEDGKTTAAGATDAAGGETTAGTTQVEISGPAMTRQLLKLADKLLSGSALLPDDAPAQLKAQVDALLKMVMSDFSQLSGGLASFVEEQRSLPQALHRLAEQVNLAQVLATAEETAATILLDDTATAQAGKSTSTDGKGSVAGNIAPAMPAATTVPAGTAAGVAITQTSEAPPVVADQTADAPLTAATDGEAAIAASAATTDNKGLAAEKAVAALPQPTTGEAANVLPQEKTVKLPAETPVIATAGQGPNGAALPEGEVPLPAPSLNAAVVSTAVKEQIGLAEGKASPLPSEQELPTPLATIPAESNKNVLTQSEQPVKTGILQEIPQAVSGPVSADRSQLPEAAPTSAPLSENAAANAGTAAAGQTKEAPFSAPAFRQFMVTLATEAEQLLGKDASTALLNNQDTSSRLATAETLLTSRANVLMHELRQENPATARFVEKTLSSLQQSMIDRGGVPAQAQTQSWKELAFAGSLMQEDSAKLQQWSGAIKDMANTWSRFSQGGAELSGGRELQMSWMLPFFDSQQGKNRPALIQVYRDKPGSGNGVEKPADTWIRVVSETENAGLVVSSFHQHGDTLDVRINPEAEEGIAVFREMLPELRQRLHELWEESGVEVQ